MGEEVTLKREVGWFGSFSLGYADVGADIFIALGLIVLYAAGVAPVVFLITAIIYICIGLAYAELAPIYPYAGGAHVYAMKAFNDLYGFIAGWALIMGYTLCISLFALTASGYLLY
ncbi:MAG: amino acid permease, partial [Nitrososphaerota archaeon]